MSNGTARLSFPGLAPGRYALRVFADENGNGKLDTNLMGMPTERYGFSNDAKGNRAAPGFDAAALQVNAKRLGGGRTAHGLLSLEPAQGKPDHVRAGALAVVGGDEVVADPQREGEHAAGLDLVLVGAEAPNSERM